MCGSCDSYWIGIHWRYQWIIGDDILTGRSGNTGGNQASTEHAKGDGRCLERTLTECGNGREW